MKSTDKIKILLNSTIKQALTSLSKGAMKIVLVVDKNDKLLGTITDGDIRRGFLKGLNINSPIKSIVNKKPLTAKKTDTKEKLLKIALSKNIFQIPLVDDNHIVKGIHILGQLIKKKKKSNKVFIMAGGEGVRLRPLTKNIPKPMLKIGNKPILQNIIEKFKDSGYENFVLCVNYKSKVIKDYFGDGSIFGVKIKYIEEKIKMGTAGALSIIKQKPKEPFFVINGDLLTNLDFEKMLDFHIQNNADATMCIAEYNFQSSYGEVSIENEIIKSINEKPVHRFYVNAGIYILNPKCVKLIPKKFYDITSLFTKMIKNKFKTISFPLGEYWLDVGRINDFKKANDDYNSLY